MSSLVSFWISAPGCLTAIAGAATWLSMRPRSAPARRFVLIIAVTYFLASLYAVPYCIGHIVLARGFAPFPENDVPGGRTAVVLLGGGGGTVRVGNTQLGIMNNDTAARTLEAFRVYTLSRADWIISSGGIPDAAKPGETSATMMRDALVGLGVASSKILLESESQTTQDEAALIAPMLRTLGANHVVLVTSDIHMRRSLGAFHAQGWRPIPAIASDPRFPKTLREWITPSNHGLGYSQAVVHEIIGLAYYAVRGRFAF